MVVALNNLENIMSKIPIYLKKPDELDDFLLKKILCLSLIMILSFLNNRKRLYPENKKAAMRRLGKAYKDACYASNTLSEFIGMRININFVANFHKGGNLNHKT